MGQLVAVTEKPTLSQGTVRYELNRALTGMGHERFASPEEAFGPRPAAELARRLFATEQVDAVHVYANMVTVELARGGDSEPLANIIRSLYTYWQPGMKPPSFEDLVPAEDAAAPAEVAEGTDPAMAAAMARVPAHLLERGKAGRDRWKAKTGG